MAGTAHVFEREWFGFLDNRVLLIGRDAWRPCVVQRCANRGAISQTQRRCGHHRHDRFVLGAGQRRWGRIPSGLYVVGHDCAAGGTATFNVNGVNSAKNMTATFTKAGTYGLTVKIVDAGGLSASSAQNVTVSATLTNISVTANGQVVKPGSVLAVSGLSQAIVAQGLDQFGYALAPQPSFTWLSITVPSGASAPSLAANGGAATVTFSKAGAYGLSVQANAAGGISVTRSVSMSVAQVVSGVKNVSTAAVNVWGTSVQLALPTFVNQFGGVMSVAPALMWSTTSLPVNAPAPVFTTNGSATTAAFAMAGYYTFNARVANAPSIAFATTVIVNQTLATITVSPNTASVLQGATQQFTPQALDQFRAPMANQQIFAWSASVGTISNSGLFTAPNSGSSCTVTVKSGTVAGAATVTLLANVGKLQDASLTKLVQSLDADGSISRQDMIQILRSVSAVGTVNSMDFSDLKMILNEAAMLNIPGYVQVLAGDVVNGNAANATYQGQALGNLTVGSSAAQLNNLIGKWFLGADHPALCNTSLVYRSTSGSLFPHTPSHADEYQGGLGDCYLISALGTLADSNPAAIQNMIVDNGDGTFTVRFYTGTYGIGGYFSDGGISAGFTNNTGTADYVTVDRMLPTTSTGVLAYADSGANYANTANSLWIPLIEKAYAQWNQTGKEGRDGQNAYASIQGGWMATVNAQALGHNATDYIMTTTNQQIAVNALAAKAAVTIGTNSWSGTVNGLYSSHAYAIVGYSTSTQTFTLYNPWGSNQPGQLTWSQLQATCSQLVVAGTSGSVPISGAVLQVAAVKISFFSGQISDFSGRISDAVAGTSLSESAATAFVSSDAAPAAAPSDSFSLAASASQELFDILGSNGEAQSQPMCLAGSAHGVLSASLVNATFAADGLLSQGEDWASVE